ncbi:MAG: glycosyltransferase family 4 protein [Patescibacteria group bacterium]|nr:glycosyltransferase family 4 protein [Patescibacteria group bacterium]MDE2591046.1 glycosyltransferase family 4 protein [Patescibacteria group bacterium]
MKIALDISPLQTGHRVRGTGFYLQHLQSALVKYFPQHEYRFFTQKDGMPTDSDIVHYPYFDPFFITLPFLPKTKTIVTVHDLTPLVFPKEFPSGIKGAVRWQVQRQLLRMTNGIITDSDSSKKDIVKFVGYPQQKIKTVYLAAGEEFTVLPKKKAQDIIAKFRLPRKFALYVGDATWNKNLPRLVEACVLAGVPLVMVGKALSGEEKIDGNNPWTRDLRKTIALAKEHSKMIHRIGFVSMEELVALYNCTTLFIMPSLYEGFGLPVLEAMACGAPVITTKEGSLPEVGGSAAFYTDAYNIRSISESIQTVWWDEKLQKELSKRGRIQSDVFSWKKTAEETIKAYIRAAG